MIFACGDGRGSGGVRRPSIRVVGFPAGRCVFPPRRFVCGSPPVHHVRSRPPFCSVSVSGLFAPMVMEVPIARQSSSALSSVGRCPLRSRERNAFDGSLASRAASSLVMSCCFSAVSISRRSRSVAERFVFRRTLGIVGSCRTVVVCLVLGRSACLCGAVENPGLFVCGEILFSPCLAAEGGRLVGAAPRSLREGLLGTRKPSAADVLVAIRAEQAHIQTRRESLESELAALDARVSRLAAAVSVIEENLRGSAVPVSSGASVVSLAERVVDAIPSSGSRRREILSVVRPFGFSDAAIDSAITRLKERGVIRREGSLVLRVERPSVPASSSSVVDPSRSQDAVPEGGGVSVDSSRSDSAVADAPLVAPVSGAPAVSPGSALTDAAADRRTLRDRVREVVATSGASTRQALLAHFKLQGVRASSVDAAVAGLCKLGVLRRGPVGAVSVVSDRDKSRQVEAAPRADAVSG